MPYPLLGLLRVVETEASFRLTEKRNRLRNSQPVEFTLCEKNYDHSLFLQLVEHAGEAEQTDLKMGYADCALPLVLEHNTPNNSIPLLWAETAGGEHGPAMRPLFRRRHRRG